MPVEPGTAEAPPVTASAWREDASTRPDTIARLEKVLEILAVHGVVETACRQARRVRLVPEADPVADAQFVERLEPQQQRLGRQRGPIGHAEPAGHHGRRGPALLKLPLLELDHALQAER